MRSLKQISKAGLTLIALVAVGTGWAQEGVVTLDATIEGNQEQPKVLYIVPWQSPQNDLDFQQKFSTELATSVFNHVEKSELERQVKLLTAAEKSSQSGTD